MRMGLGMRSGGSQAGAALSVIANGVAPANTILPTISGIMQVDEILTIDPGMFSGSPAAGVTWVLRRDGVVISKASNQTSYLIEQVDLNGIFTVTVTASNGVAPNAIAVSAPSQSVIAALTWAYADGFITSVPNGPLNLAPSAPTLPDFIGV